MLRWGREGVVIVIVVIVIVAARTSVGAVVSAPIDRRVENVVVVVRIHHFRWVMEEKERGMYLVKSDG